MDGLWSRLGRGGQIAVIAATLAMLGAGLAAVAVLGPDGGSDERRAAAARDDSTESLDPASPTTEDGGPGPSGPPGSAPDADRGATGAGDPGGQPSGRRSDRFGPAEPGTYTYRDTANNNEVPRTYSPTRDEGGGVVQSIRQGSRGFSDAFRFGPSGIALVSTTFPGPPDQPERTCRWDPAIPTMKFPVAVGQSWSATGTCTFEDANSKQTWTRTEKVGVKEQRTMSYLGQTLDVVVIETESRLKIESQPKFQVQDYDGPYGSETVTTRLSTISIKHGVALTEDMTISSSAPSGSGSGTYRLELNQLAPTT